MGVIVALGAEGATTDVAGADAAALDAPPPPPGVCVGGCGLTGVGPLPLELSIGKSKIYSTRSILKWQSFSCSTSKNIRCK